jgi:hypothetical protein
MVFEIFALFRGQLYPINLTGIFIAQRRQVAKISMLGDLAS